MGRRKPRARTIHRPSGAGWSFRPVPVVLLCSTTGYFLSSPAGLCGGAAISVSKQRNSNSMTARTVILRSVRHYWRTHLGVIFGAALGAMVLIGALLVGDSVKATLRRQAELRVGKADVAMTGGDRFFRTALADAAGAEAAPVLMLRATVARADGGARVNVAQLLGVDGRFWKLSPAGAAVELPDDGVALNARLAQQLGVAPGDTVIVRVEKPGAFSRDAPLSGEENDAVALRVRVARIVSDEEYGRFALAASQVPPFTVFASLNALQVRLGLSGKANLLLANLPKVGVSSSSIPTLIGGRAFNVPMWLAKWIIPGTDRLLRGEVSLVSLPANIRETLVPEDGSFDLRYLPNNSGLELRTSRVFLDPPVVAAAPRGKDDRRVDSLTYFVNELRAGDKATPYSMVTAVEAPSSGFLPAELADDEIVISQWEADDLGIGTGAKVTVKYFTMGERRQLVEKAREFTVLAVLPMSEPQLNPSWMPDFPGLADKKNCRDWKPGFEFDATRMRDKDQAYWEQYRGTPKAFVNLKAGQEMWGNRWGNTTALRWPAGTDRAEIEKALREKLTPEMLGFQFIPLREQALAATKAPVDFGELFVSFSFFLIIAAAALTGLLFVFSIEQRNAEAGLLLALGLRPRQVRRMFVLEGAALAVIGSVLGVAGAALYTKLVLRALATVWRGAVGAVQFEFVMPPATLAIGAVSGVLTALLAMWLASRRQMRRTARELLSGGAEETEVGKPRRGFQRGREAAPRVPTPGEGSGGGAVASERAPISSAPPPPPSPKWEPAARLPYHRGWGTFGAAGALTAIAALVAFFGGGSPEVFFGAGSLLLIAGVLAALAVLRRSANAADGIESLAQLGTRNAARRRGRSLATIAVLASGVFMVVAVDSFRHGPVSETTKRDSGTGGFALVGESALPIYEDLNSAKGREAYGLDERIMESVSVVPMRVRDGDDASCLNLNRAMQPRVLGVKSDDLAKCNAFRFSDVAWRPYAGIDVPKKTSSRDVWALLDRVPIDDIRVTPGFADDATIQWALQSKVGGILNYRDERGEPLPVQLVAAVGGSILQGSVIVSEQRFIEKFPNSGGYRFFLIDCPPEKVGAVREHLSRQLADRGLELTTTAQRLAEFQAVENTYLSIFQVLGGLGLLLGSAGLAIVVARNVLERRSEFGLLEAVGFRPGQLRSLVFAEHRWLIVAALFIGTASALVAVWPNVRERANGFPYAETGLLLAALLAGCIFWMWLATRLALRGSRIEALRGE